MVCVTSGAPRMQRGNALVISLQPTSDVTFHNLNKTTGGVTSMVLIVNKPECSGPPFELLRAWLLLQSCKTGRDGGVVSLSADQGAWKDSLLRVRHRHRPQPRQPLRGLPQNPSGHH